MVWTCLLMTLIGLVMSGCASTDVTQVKEGAGGLSGNWSFVYYEASDTEESSMPGPPFDSLRFVDSRLVYIRQALHGGPALCTYELRGKDLRVQVPVAGRGTVTVRCQAYLAEEGRILVLRDTGTGAVFVRTESLVQDVRFLIGDWSIFRRDGRPVDSATLSHGGGILFRRSGFHGSYRLWRSGSGLMMSAFLWVPQLGVRTVVWRLEDLGSEGLRLSPYGPTGLIRKNAMSWKRGLRGSGKVK